MNSEQLTHQAGVAIEEFSRTHNCACTLSIKNGLVLTTPARERPITVNLCLTVSLRSQTVGFTSVRWSRIGAALLDLYNKEKLCHEHQKH